MNWFRAHHGISADPKFLRIMASTGADGAQVLGIWIALLDYASQAEPRGSVVDFSHEDCAAFFRMEVDQVSTIVAALRQRGMIDASGMVAKWDRRQKADPGAAERMRRYRARKKKVDQEGEPEAGASTPRESCDLPENVVTKRNGYACNASRDLEEREQSSLSSVASRQASKNSTPSSALHARAHARGAVGVLDFLQRQGVDASLLKAAFNRSTVNAWCQSGVTDEQLAEAVTRAKRQRIADGDADRPINLKFLDCFVGDVLAGRPSRASNTRTRSTGYAATDRNVADFVARSR